MLKFINSVFEKLFTTTSSYSHDLDNFVLSKKPSSVVEMEFWVKEYDRKMTRGQSWIL